jgi:glycosyltransferase involved in cell wall biosynthesis
MKIAICVCTCNRPSSLERLLESLVNLSVDGLAVGSVELIVIDNRPNGLARQLCASVSARLPIKLHFVEEPKPGISYARNRAVDVALEHGADLVSFIDDDDVPERDWLSHLVGEQKQTGADLVFGRWSFVAGPSVPTWISENPKFKSSDYEKRDVYGLPPWASTCNVLLSSRLLQAMRRHDAPFSPEFAFFGGEDKDFFIRALAMGGSYATSSRSMVIRHDVEARFTTVGILRRSFGQGCSKVNIMRKHRTESELIRLSGRAWQKLIVTVLSLPLQIFSLRRMILQLSKAAKNTGIIYGYFGGRYNYYQER